MSSLTTSEEIQKQLSIIFGFSGREEIKVGEIVGVGNLTRGKVSELILQVLSYLNEYSALLKDYLGTEIFSMEFELKFFSNEKHNLKLLPKSMILIPGEYKENSILLIALTKELSLLDVNKAKNSINDLGKLFFEVEEVVERPELNKKEKTAVLSNFANRFAYKIQGQFLEGKWNKKLVGIKRSSPTENQNFKTYLSLQSKYSINWNSLNRNLISETAKYSNENLSISENRLFEHLKWSISGPSGFFIVKKSFDLGAQLLRIANIGSVNEYQEKIVRVLIDKIGSSLRSLNKIIDFEKEIIEFKILIKEIYNFLSIFEKKLNSFLKSGVSGDLASIFSKLDSFVVFENSGNSEISINLVNILKDLIKSNEFKNEKSIILVEIESSINYFIRLVLLSQKIIENNFERYFSYIYYQKLYKKLLSSIYSEISFEEIPVKALGGRFIARFSEELSKNINENTINQNKYKKFDRNLLKKEYYKIVEKTLKLVGDLPVYTDDLINFAEIMLGKHASDFKMHFTHLKEARSQFNFLLSFLLRNSTLNRFLNEISEKDIFDPISLSELFYDFMRKRIGGLNLYWKEFILNLIKSFGENYQKQYEEDSDKGINWSKYKLVNEFLRYFSDKIKDLTIPSKFIEVINYYISSVSSQSDREFLQLVLEQYEFSLDIIDDFPNYLKQKIFKILNNLDFSVLPMMTADYLHAPHLKIKNEYGTSHIIKINEVNLDLFDFINEFELKYFSKLIAVPSKIILKNINDSNSFVNPLYYELSFTFWEKFFKLNISDNWHQIRSKF